jgi:hypothetical protein
MADHSYEIVVKLQGAGGGGSSGGGGGGNTAEENTANPFKETVNFIKNSIAFKEISGIAKRSASFVVTNIGLTTGNSDSQQEAEFALSALGTIGAVGLSIGTGNYIAAALIGLHTVTDIFFKQQQIDLEQRIESESLHLARQRAGAAFNRSRMGGAE